MLTQKDGVQVGKQYKHYKGGIYRVIALARNCSSGFDGEVQVVYRGKMTRQTWIRPLSEWTALVPVRQGSKTVSYPRYELL